MIAPSSFERLQNSPLAHVLMQVRFSPVLDMASAVARVQAGLRAFGFIKLKDQPGQRIRFQGAAPPIVEAVPRWEFFDRGNTHSVILTQDFVAIQTSRYERFEGFQKLVRNVLDVLAEHTPISWVTRIGLRYVNLVRSVDSAEYGRYVVPGLFGFPVSSVAAHLAQGGAAWDFATQASVSTRTGTLAVQTYVLPSGQVLPPDLAPATLHYDAKFTVAHPAIALDFDHFTESDFEFDPERIQTSLSELHDIVKDAFLGSVTQYAIERWNEPGAATSAAVPHTSSRLEAT